MQILQGQEDFARNTYIHIYIQKRNRKDIGVWFLVTDRSMKRTQGTQIFFLIFRYFNILRNDFDNE